MAKKKKLKKEVKELFNLTIKQCIWYGLFLIAFILLMAFIFDKHPDFLYKFDNAFISFRDKYLRSDLLTVLLTAITYLGSYASYILIVIIAFIIFRKKTAIPFFMMASGGGASVINSVIKHFIERPRPVSALIAIPDSSSFPSGHTMCAVTFYMYLIHLVNRYVTDKPVKICLNILFVILPILIGFSRMYLGVHYASDVIFGAFVGAITYIPFVKVSDEIRKCFKW